MTPGRTLLLLFTCLVSCLLHLAAPAHSAPEATRKVPPPVRLPDGTRLHQDLVYGVAHNDTILKGIRRRSR